jgi:hypothetical protein
MLHHFSCYWLERSKGFCCHTSINRDWINFMRLQIPTIRFIPWNIWPQTKSFYTTSKKFAQVHFEKRIFKSAQHNSTLARDTFRLALIKFKFYYLQSTTATLKKLNFRPKMKSENKSSWCNILHSVFGHFDKRL